MNPSEMTDQELTQAVAEEVMGWENPGDIPLGDYEHIWEGHVFIGFKDRETGIFFHVTEWNKLLYYYKDNRTIIEKRLWQPLTDARHWMKVVERMVEKEYDFTIGGAEYGDKRFVAHFYPYIHGPWAVESPKWIEFDDISKIGRAVLEAALEADRRGQN